MKLNSINLTESSAYSKFIGGGMIHRIHTEPWIQSGMRYNPHPSVYPLVISAYVYPEKLSFTVSQYK